MFQETRYEVGFETGDFAKKMLGGATVVRFSYGRIKCFQVVGLGLDMEFLKRKR